MKEMCLTKNKSSLVGRSSVITGMNLRLFLVIKLMTIGVIWESLEIVKVVIISFIRIEKGKRELQGYEAFCRLINPFLNFFG